MTDKQKKILKLLLRIAVTSGLLVWVFRSIDNQQFYEALKLASDRWQYLVGAWTATVVFFFINSYKLRLILKTQDFSVSVARIFDISAVTTLYGMVMPGMLSWAVKWYLFIKGRGKGANVFSGLVYNQLSTMVVMMIFGLGALALSNPLTAGVTDAKYQNIIPVACILLSITVVVVSVLLLGRRTGGKVINAVDYLLKPLPAAISQRAGDVLKQIAVFQTLKYRFHFLMALITIAGTVVGGVIFYVCAAKAANVTVSIKVLVWLWAAVFILQRVPISIANLGVREVTITSMLSLYGIEKADALIMSMIIFSSSIVMALIGAVIMLAGTFRIAGDKQKGF